LRNDFVFGSCGGELSPVLSKGRERGGERERREKEKEKEKEPRERGRQRERGRGREERERWREYARASAQKHTQTQKTLTQARMNGSRLLIAWVTATATNPPNKPTKRPDPPAFKTHTHEKHKHKGQGLKWTDSHALSLTVMLSH